MKSNQKTVIGVILCLMFIAALSVFGQTNDADVRPVDTQIKGFIANFSYFKLLIVPLTGLLCAGIKHLASFIPNKYIPVIGPLLGGAMDLLASKFGFWTGNGEAGLMMGALSTWAHQLVTRVPAPQNPTPPKE